MYLIRNTLYFIRNTLYNRNFLQATQEFVFGLLLWDSVRHEETGVIANLFKLYVPTLRIL